MSNLPYVCPDHPFAAVKDYVGYVRSYARALPTEQLIPPVKLEEIVDEAYPQRVICSVCSRQLAITQGGTHRDVPDEA